SSYTFRISTYTESGAIGNSIFTVTLAHPGTYYVLHNLNENTTYWARVYSYDSEDASNNSTFLETLNWVAINSINEPPYPFELIYSSGVMSYSGADTNIYLDWEEIPDPDPGDFIHHYEVYWASYPEVEYSNFSGSATVVVSSFTITYGLKEDTTFWWFAVACDSGWQEVDSSRLKVES
ncbi:unnamed protein product, partial [marine sediment metagenome]